ncbi:hypothetical protein GN956_G2449 [Arapaima gigas]
MGRPLQSQSHLSRPVVITIARAFPFKDNDTAVRTPAVGVCNERENKPLLCIFPGCWKTRILYYLQVAISKYSHFNFLPFSTKWKRC